MPTILLLFGTALCIAFYIAVYFTAEAPKTGTLEWIDLYSAPQMTRQGVLHRLKWLDILWCFLMGLMAFGLHLSFGACVDVSMVRTSLASGWAFLTALPAVLAVMAAYLLGKLLSGRFLGGFLPALLLGCGSLISLYFAETLLMLGCLLLVLVFFTGKGFWAWLCLVLSGMLLALSTWFHPTYIFFLLPWLGTVLFAEILRMKREDASFWHLLLAVLAALLSVGVTVAIVHFPLYAADLSAALKTPGCYFMFWLQLVISIPAKFLAAPEVSPILLLPSAALLLSGVVMAIGAVKKHHTLGVLMLLWTGFGLILAVCFPYACPIFLPILVLAWLVSRIYARGYSSAATITGLMPTVISLLMTILTLWRYVL